MADMTINSVKYYLIDNGSGAYVGAVQSTVDSNGDFQTISFDPIEIVRTDAVFQAILNHTDDANVTETPDPASPPKVPDQS